MSDSRPHILILGGGFSGIFTILNLQKKIKCSNYRITVVNKNNYFLFTPMLHEVATGGLNTHHITEPIRQITRGCLTEFIQAEVEKIDLKKKQVETTKGKIKYDYLVIGLGSEPNYRGITGAKENSLQLHDLQDAWKIRGYFIDVFEHAATIKGPEKRKAYLTFAVVGGGATGVELVAEAAELFFDAYEKYYRNTYPTNDATLYLINRGSDILSQFPKHLRKKSADILIKNGVKIIFNASVKKISEHHVTLSNGEKIHVEHTVWAGGVKPVEIQFGRTIEKDKSGRLVVDKHLRLKGQYNVFALGDIASFSNNLSRPLPMLAQVAVQQADVVAQNIVRTVQREPLIKFSYKDRGSLVSIGQWNAVGKIGPFHLSGKFAWWLWRTIYLSKLASWKNRIKVAIDWTINLFYPRDITKI